MNLSPALEKTYTKERYSTEEAQRLAEFVAFGPMIFQVTRLMHKFGIFQLLREKDEGMTREEISSVTGLSDYAVKCLLEASLSIGSVYVNSESEKFFLSKMGWFFLTDAALKVNMDFNHDVNYCGMFRLEESLLNGRPEGLKHFGSWKTIYEGLSQLPADAQKSWFGFDHFYSDHSFDQALAIIFAGRPLRLLDVGGNTGRWALRCVAYDPDVRVTIVDLPQQIDLLRSNIRGKEGAERIDGLGMDLLDKNAVFPQQDPYDAIWMSQFLDCFSPEEIVGILQRASKAMDRHSVLYIMETLWDRQRYETAAFCLTQTSLYFTALANGNSKMYNTDDMEACIAAAGLQVVEIHDHIGFGHSIISCKLK